MTEDDDQTKSGTPEFDFSSFPSNTLFHERRYGRERRTPASDQGHPPDLRGTPKGFDLNGEPARNDGSGSIPPRSRNSTPTMSSSS